MAKNLSRTTTDHDEIRRWVEERGGTPAEVASTAREGEPGILRIDFPGYSGEGKLQGLDWDTWFQKFDRSGLAFVFQETTAGGERSNFNKLVSREAAQVRRKPAARRGTRSTGRREAARTASRKPASSKSKRSAAGSRGGKRTAAGRGTAKKRRGR